MNFIIFKNIKIFIVLTLLFFINFCFFPEIITKLNTKKNLLALTFDACETKTASYFDEDILKYIIENKINATLFISGKFAKRNSERLKEISKLNFIEIENHSLNHYMNMQKLDVATIKTEVLENEKLLESIIGYKTIFFRFPAGNYDKKTLDIVESLGYKVVHWAFASGDPDKNVTAEKLENFVVTKSKPSDVLIFHINGRGYNTKYALPKIVERLKNKGYSFVKLKEYIN